MKNFIKLLRALAYLASVVLPIIDAGRGIKRGIKLGMMDRDEREQRRYEKEVHGGTL